jgi:hypothetical protein
MSLRSGVILVHAVLAVGIRLHSDVCNPLQSGAKIHLKSNVLEGHFITADEGSGDCGNPYLWNDMKHWTCSKFHLTEGMSPNSTFRIVSQSGGPIVSGEMVKLVSDQSGKQVSLDMSLTKQWPLTMSLESEGSNIQIQKARRVDVEQSPQVMKMSFGSVHEDRHAGAPICSGKKIFMRIMDEQRSFELANPVLAGPCGGSSPACGYYYLQGDADKIVGFPHHYPGHSGNPDDIRRGADGWNANDPEALSNTFTIIADSETKKKHL